jgi:hypothetical protein
LDDKVAVSRGRMVQDCCGNVDSSGGEDGAWLRVPGRRV